LEGEVGQTTLDLESRSGVQRMSVDGGELWGFLDNWMPWAQKGISRCQHLGVRCIRHTCCQGQDALELGKGHASVEVDGMKVSIKSLAFKFF
jgi:hypothetical protein